MHSKTTGCNDVNHYVLMMSPLTFQNASPPLLLIRDFKTPRDTLFGSNGRNHRRGRVCPALRSIQAEN